jgi:hypothetical protein
VAGAGRVTFFFDNNHSPEIVQILRQAEVDVLHLQEVFHRGADDAEWLPQIEDRGRGSDGPAGRLFPGTDEGKDPKALTI